MDDTVKNEHDGARDHAPGNAPTHRAVAVHVSSEEATPPTHILFIRRTLHNLNAEEPAAVHITPTPLLGGRLLGGRLRGSAFADTGLAAWGARAYRYREGAPPAHHILCIRRILRDIPAESACHAHRPRSAIVSASAPPPRAHACPSLSISRIARPGLRSTSACSGSRMYRSSSSSTSRG
ncbi:hypothetical protein HYPSUDRAFT_206678 [Hypholoma sublateritium FD-334 SS-4]|uniref:Uncharacterized protein n=1 Tax=Hypholoma sublateritium (strain FD-334 SS-4) TaxID=945553 RepID=A0A0D2P949_HYPSF|nr:hypothetical protein HYPSUDRAFT_206678 [Hypholoma sublateritium FD-334 SS-4]